MPSVIPELVDLDVLLGIEELRGSTSTTVRNQTLRTPATHLDVILEVGAHPGASIRIGTRGSVTGYLRIMLCVWSGCRILACCFRIVDSSSRWSRSKVGRIDGTGLLRLASTLCDHHLSSTFSYLSHFYPTHNTATANEHSSDLPWATTQASTYRHVPTPPNAATAIITHVHPTPPSEPARTQPIPARRPRCIRYRLLPRAHRETTAVAVVARSTKGVPQPPVTPSRRGEGGSNAPEAGGVIMAISAQDGLADCTSEEGG